ncbi:unnamed protein product [Pleuronectes platessa]|uniref:Uncharacterized protein n=1 Tax=Pleuronectes platessa TaxID=8262 RepID=A0A9N7UQ40_PLEPL|nr:unnamed protein product [Pleuronectes platessa]
MRFISINLKRRTKSSQGKLVSKETGKLVQKKAATVNPHVSTLKKDLIDFEWGLHVTTQTEYKLPRMLVSISENRSSSLELRRSFGRSKFLQPWPSLGSGFYFLDDRLSNDLEKEFTPSDGKAKAEREYVQETFHGNDSCFPA